MYRNVSLKWDENIYKNVQSILNIYFDDVLINPNYITEFKPGKELFEEDFELGKVVSQYIELQIHKKANIKIPKVIKIDYGILINNALTVEELNDMLIGTLDGIPVKSLSGNNSDFEIIPIGIYNVDDYNDEDDNVINIKASDNIIKLDLEDGYYDASELIKAKGYATLKEIAIDICKKKGLEFGSQSFLNSEKKIYTYDNEIKAREYMSFIGENGAGFLCAGRDGKIYVRQIGEDKKEIPFNLFKTHKFGEEYQISGVSYENGTESFKFGDNSRNTLWINQDNIFITDEEQVKNIYNAIKGLTINSFEGTTIIDPTIDLGDIIIVNGKQVVYQGQMSFSRRFMIDITSKISIKQKQETTVRKQSQKSINRKLQSQIDEENLKIIQLAKEQTETSNKLTKHEQDINGIKDTVSSVETRVEDTEETVKETKENLEKNYPTKIEMNSAIEQSAGVITSEVKKTVSKAKQEAVEESDSNTDEKLKEYVVEEELGTKIEQNHEHIKYAWNKISEFIQLEIIDGTPVLAIKDEYKNLLMTLNKTGQDFYKNGKVFGEMGVETIRYGDIDENYIAFSVKTDESNQINDEMAWGLKNKKGDFCPILCIKNFYAGSENSDDMYGQLVLSDCDLVLNGINTGIIGGSVKMYSDILLKSLIFQDIESGKILFKIMSQNNIVDGGQNGFINILDRISFYANDKGSNSLKIGDDDKKYCLLTDEGSLHCSNIKISDGSNGVYIRPNGEVVGASLNFMGLPTYQGELLVYGTGHKYHLYWSGSRLHFYVDVTDVGNISDKRLKTEIKDVDKDLIKAIGELNYKQFKKDNRNGLLSVGIIAQDLIEILKKYEKNPADYELLEEFKYKSNEDTLYYRIDYEQFLLLRMMAKEQEIEELQEKDKQKDEIIQNLLKRVENLEGGIK